MGNMSAYRGRQHSALIKGVRHWRPGWKDALLRISVISACLGVVFPLVLGQLHGCFIQMRHHPVDKASNTLCIISKASDHVPGGRTLTKSSICSLRRDSPV